MPALDLLAIAFFVVAIAGSAAYLVVRALTTWRTFRAFNRSAGGAVEHVATTAAAIEARAASLSDKSERLTAATAHLQESLAQLAVIRAAFGEAQQFANRLSGTVPLK